MRSVLLGVVVFLLALARSIADGVGYGDESWFLQVVSRMRGAETLYRDIFLGVTPISAYVTAFVTLVTGIDVLAVKIVTNACFAVTSVLTYRLARKIGFSEMASLTVAAAMFVWGRPYNNPPYTAMAVTFLMAAFASSVGATSPGAWIAAGVLAGLSFGAKQNVGLLALAAVCGAIALRREARPTGLASVAIGTLAGFVLAVNATLLPVVASGATAAFWEYGFGAKGTYLDLGAVSYADSLQVLGSWLTALPSPSAAAGALHASVVVLPLLVATAAVTSVRKLDRRDWTLLLFAGAATLAAFPRWDRFHMGYAVPFDLIALGRILTHWLPAPTLRRVQYSAVAVAGALAVLVAAQPAFTLLGGTSLSVIPHFRAALMNREEQVTLLAAADTLRGASAGQPVFVLSPHAGFWYLSSGVTNPTAFDAPHRTAVGRSGIPRLLDRLAAGSIARVCVDNGPADAQTLTEIAAYVRRTFVEVSDAGPCTMFRAPHGNE